MLVLAAVSDVQYQRLRGAVMPRFTLARAPTWDVALETIKCRPVEIAVVDPMLGGARGQEVERLRILFPSLPFILYTPVMTPELAPVLLQMGKCGITQVVLSRTEDHPTRLRDLLSAEAMHAASHRLLEQLTTALAPLPPELRWVLEDALRTPGEARPFHRAPPGPAVVVAPWGGLFRGPGCRAPGKFVRRRVGSIRTGSPRIRALRSR